MPIERAGWPLGAVVICEVCDTKFSLDIGDAARIVVDPEKSAITVDAGCPGCDTMYTATKAIGTHQTPDWVMCENQHNRVEPGERVD